MGALSGYSVSTKPCMCWQQDIHKFIYHDFMLATDPLIFEKLDEVLEELQARKNTASLRIVLKNTGYISCTTNSVSVCDYPLLMCFLRLRPQQWVLWVSHFHICLYVHNI